MSKLEHFPYRVFVEWSDEDGVYVARVPAFEGLAVHGDTPEAAAHEAHVGAEAMIAVLKRSKRPVPAPDAAGAYSGQLRLRLPTSLHARLAQRAAAEGVSLNTLLVTLISAR